MNDSALIHPGVGVKQKILIIDDDQLILYGLRKALQKESVEVTTASSAAAAEDELNSRSYNLCLLDIHLRDHNGQDLMKTISCISPETRIVVMTAGHMGEDELSDNIRKASENGACHFLAKPFALNEVKDIIRQVLQNHDFQTGTCLSDRSRVSQVRRFTRKPHSQKMNIAMTVLRKGKTQRWSFGAESFDISEGGVGLKTEYPLPVSQVLSLKSDTLEKTGVVVWSRMLADNTCKAGVCFAWDGKPGRD